MPFIDTGKLFTLFGVDIHIGVNIFAILMLAVAVLTLFGTINAIREKNIIAIIFAGLSTLCFGFFALATIFTYGYPLLQQ
ncbi:DUF2759 domain-containing protein [Abyssicoccus albus]|uniref:Uncharacterized protein DUF2759 n=1 Tax=Abyssicoccus albus TaxID=1817405 RepID=A0A1Q1G160_9BACL|nr:DUF2759 domain-containing protein [Abyssicoccus albus]AQL56088.1 hypothetical protein BVH56_03725 [Abyssicoccus albus]RPF58099.1 uncharacterized protein DUF2759 [Abyssicoccus albus]